MLHERIQKNNESNKRMQNKLCLKKICLWILVRISQTFPELSVKVTLKVYDTKSYASVVL